MMETGRETVAISLLHAYANPEHERCIRDQIAARAPELLVSISSDISPKFREYERTNTTVTNAYVKPIVDRYLRHLDEALEARGIRNELFVMQSSGGLISPDLARDFPVRIIESGPAAGILMCAVVGKRKAETRSSPSTWEAPPRSSAPSTTARQRSCRPSRSISSATRRAAGCRSMCRPSR